MSANFPPSGLPVSDAPEPTTPGTAAPFESLFGDELHGGAMDAFAVRVLSMSVAGVAATRRGIFDRLHLEIGMDGDGAPVSASRSQLGIAVAEWGTPREGDAVQVRIRHGEAVHFDQAPSPVDVVLHYVVTQVQLDGTGGALLVLGGRAPAFAP
jgi:hypothetical protein